VTLPPPRQYYCTFRCGCVRVCTRWSIILCTICTMLVVHRPRRRRMCVRLCRIFVRVCSKFIFRPSYAYEKRAQTRVGAYILYIIYIGYIVYRPPPQRRRSYLSFHNFYFFLVVITVFV